MHLTQIAEGYEPQSIYWQEVLKQRREPDMQELLELIAFGRVND